MSLTVQQGVPSVLTMGDAVSFKVTESDFPAGVWTSQIVFKDSAGAILPFTGSTSGTDHLFALTNANTATLVAGQNTVTIVFSDGTNRQTRAYDDITVLPDPAAASSPTFAQQQVTLLRAVIAGFSASAERTVSFNGQSFTRDSIGDYRDQLVYWQALVIREGKLARSARGLTNTGTVQPQFVRDECAHSFPFSTLNP